MKIGFLKEEILPTPANASTYNLFHEGQVRGGSLYHFRPQDLAFQGNYVTARARKTVFDDDHIHFSQGDFERINLNDLDVILLRLDPPFDSAYYMTLAILEHVDPSVLILNSPYGMKNILEKMCPFDISQYTPKTIVTLDHDAIRSFIGELGHAVLKPLNASGGASVFFTHKDDPNQDVIIDSLFEMYHLPIVVQEILDIKKHGDKRIVLLDGEPVGCYVRMPSEESLRANLASGGEALKGELTEHDLEVCAALKPELQARGIFICGLDMIGGKVTEVNVRNPAFVGLKRTGGVDVAKLFWDKVEKKRKSGKI